jgi:hypothetical protein
MEPVPPRVSLFGLPGCSHCVMSACVLVYTPFFPTSPEEEKTYPGATDSQVQNDVHGRVGQRLPDVLVVDLRARNGVVELAVEVKVDALLLPRAGRVVPDDAPHVPAVVGQGGRLAEPAGLVADAAGRLVAVDSAVARQHAVDRLHDVDLAARRPAAARAERLAEQPEGRPQALPLRLGVGAKVNARLGDGLGILLGREGVLALDATRGPAVLGRRVPVGGELEGALAAALDISAGGRVRLQFAVDAEVARDDIPVLRGGCAAGVSGEVGIPLGRVSAIARRVVGSYEAWEQGQRYGRKKAGSMHGGKATTENGY